MFEPVDVKYKAERTPEQYANSIERYRAAGYEVRVADNYQIQLDLDSYEALQEATARLEEWERELEYTHLEYRVSKSGHSHIYVHLPRPMDREERLFWQVALGSDARRETLNYLEFKAGIGECYLVEVPEGRDDLRREIPFDDDEELDDPGQAGYDY